MLSVLKAGLVNILVENGDFMSIDDQLVTLQFDLPLEAAVSGVILKHVDLTGKVEGLER